MNGNSCFTANNYLWIDKVMPIAQILQQILIIFCYVSVGYTAGKLKLINPEQRVFLTRFCSSLVLPFTILSGASLELGAEEFSNLKQAVAMMFIVFGGTMALSLIIHRLIHTEKKLAAAITSLITFPNCTFLGLPLCLALFGEIAVLYNSAAMIAFNVLFFAIQVPMFTGERFRLKSLLSVPNITTALLLVMLILGLHWPAPIQTVISSIGTMITPLSLIIIGVMLSENDLLALFREKLVYLVALFRNFLIPLVTMLLLTPLKMDLQSKLCILVFISCPCATLTTIYSIQTGTKPELCARSVLFSTIVFSVSLPAVMALGQALLG